MRRIAITLLCLFLATTLFASPIAFGLDSSFDIPYLINNDFKLEILEEKDKSVNVTPPESNISLKDATIDEFYVFPVKNSHDWDSLNILFKDSIPYSTAYNFVKADYGEGMSKERTLDYINKHYIEPSEEIQYQKYLEGNIGSFLSDYYIARALKAYIDSEPVENLNMWINDDVVIFAFQSKGQKCGIFFINYAALKSGIERLFATAYELFS